METYGGYSLGEMGGSFGFSRLNESKEFAKASFNRLFLQLAIGYSADIVDLALAPRMSWVNLRVKEGEYTNNRYSNFYFEPVINAKLGYRYVKFIAQFGVSLPVNTISDYTWRWLIFNIGLQAQLGQSFD